MSVQDVYWVRPLQRAPQAVVEVPGSKSITNRALLLAALARGRSRIEGALVSDDTRYMAGALRDLGIAVEFDAASSCFLVEGGGGSFPAQQAELYVGNAGTAMRFLVAAVCLGRGDFRIDGTPRMRERPIEDLLLALRELGAAVESELGNGCPPVRVRAAGLAGGRTRVRGERSSQYLSALLQVGPCTQRGLEVEVEGRLVAAPYVNLTVAVMEQFGAHVERQGNRWFHVLPTGYGGRDFRVEPDASSAHYFWAAAALCGGRIRTPGLGARSLQGDVRFAELLAQMGAEVEIAEDWIEVRGGRPLVGLDVDMNEISDTAMTLAVLGVFTTSPVCIRNVGHLRLQESDRLHAVATELTRLGIRVEEEEDALRVFPGRVRPGVVETYDDHRIAMSFALLGLRVPGIGIRNPRCVEKTFPEFFTLLESLGQ
jgi:3-phosphoshikimate 1-carboxyvinyltransferase